MPPERLHDVAELVRELILIPSATARPDDIERCIDFIADTLEVDGVRVDRYSSGGNPSLVAMPRGVTRPDILFTGHIDVVKIAETSDYRARMEDGRIVGPGAADMKGAVALMMEVFLNAQKRRPGSSVGIAITSDEETGGANGIGFLFRKKGLRAGTVILPDSGSLLEIATAEKGILHIRITEEGEAGHGARPWLVRNALDEICSSLALLRDRFAGFTGEDHWHPTCAVTNISTPHPANNCIPAHASATLDIRYTHQEKESELLALVHGSLSARGSIEHLYGAPPTTLQPDPLFIRITEEVTGGSVRLIRAHGGSDARYVTEHGIPVIMSRPNVGGVHSVHEWVEIASLGMLGKIYDTYLERVLKN